MCLIHRLVLILAGCVIHSKAQTYTDAKNLHAYLTTGRNKEIRPVFNQSMPVFVAMYFHLTYLQEFDEVEGKLSVRGYFGILWNDPTAAWDEKIVSLKSITFTDEAFWKPTLIMSNPFGESKIIYKDDSVKRLKSNGDMEWYPGDSYEVTCQADVTKYPFDEHHCYLGVVASIYGENEVYLVPIGFPTDWYVPHKTWSLEETRFEKIPFPQSVYFHMKFKRRSMFFVMNFILPIVLMSFLNPLVFLLPANSGERVGYAVTVLLAMAVFLTISSDNLPSASEPQLPVICILLFIDVSLSALMVLLVIITLRFHLCEDSVPVPKLWKGFVRFFRCLRCGCCRKYQFNAKDKIDSEKMVVGEKINTEKLASGEYMYRGTTISDQSSNSSVDDITWQDVGTETDFVFGCLSVIFMVTVHVIYILHVVYGIFEKD